MNNNIVTQRFIKCLAKLRENKTIKSSRQFALELEYLPQSLSEILNGRRDVTIELVRKAVEVYKLNPIFLFTGEGSLFLSENDAKELRVLTVVADASTDEKIVHVPVPAYAGYVSELNEPNFVKNLPTYTLPDYKYQVGTHRSFDVAGDAMEPTLFEGDKVVCSYLEPALWETAVRDNYVYVIVTKDDILVRRVHNQLKNSKLLHVSTDNNFYEPFEIPLSNIREIWYVRAKISPFLPSPNRIQQLFLTDVNDLKNTVKEQSRIIESLHKTIEKLFNEK